MVRVSSIAVLVSVLAESASGAALTNAVTMSESMSAPVLGDDVYSLAPLGGCPSAAKCYQGPTSALDLVKNFELSLCNSTITRPGGCALYGFPTANGAYPFLPKVKIFAQGPGPHLWFNLLNGAGCGEVDAATRMPAAIFHPGNQAALDAYIRVTVQDYGARYALKVGRCVDRGYTEYSGILSGVDWIGNTASTCKAGCGCDPSNDDGRGGCPDQPDDPAKGTWCSLCNKANNLPVDVTIYIRKPQTRPPTPAPHEGKTIVDLAVATPDLSTLVTAVKAADLVSTLSSPGPFTVFAPTNEAFAALPAGTVAGLLKPENKDQLVKILTYHVVSGDLQAKDLRDGQVVTTVQGQSLTVRIDRGVVFINSAKVTTADVEASNGVVHIVDGVLLPR